MTDTSETTTVPETEIVPPVEAVETPKVAPMATTEDLLGGAAVETPAASEAETFGGEDLPPPVEMPAGPVTPPGIADNGKQGCQCEQCKTSGKAERRGRHHKACPCPICAAKTAAPAGNAPTVAAAAPTAPAAPVANPFEVAAPVEATKNFQALAGMTFDVSVNTLSMVFGPEWQPQNNQEKEQVVAALANYYRAKDMSDLPPGALLALVVVAYSAPRFTKPNTRNKLLLGWQWLKVKAGGFFSFLKRK